MQHKSSSIKSNNNFRISGSIKFNLILALAVILIISGITLSILNNSGIIGKLDPAVIKNYNIPGEVTDIFIEGNYAYLTYNIYDNDNLTTPIETGLQIINISYKEDPQLITDYKTPMDADCVFVKGSFAYIGGRGLQIVNIGDKENPEIVASCAMDLDDSHIHIEENYAYITGYENTKGYYCLCIVDISNKGNPKIVGVSAIDDKVLDTYVKENYAYIANWNRGLLIIDISDKKNPKIAGSCDTPIATSVFIEGDYAYVIDYGLQIIDITNKKNPYPLGNCPIPGSGYDVCVVKNYAYVVNSGSYSNENATGGLQIINISDKKNPKIAASCAVDIPNLESLKVCIEGNYAYIVGRQTGLQIIKIMN